MAHEPLFLIERLAVVVDGRAGPLLRKLCLERAQDGLGVGRGNHPHEDPSDRRVPLGEGLAADDVSEVAPAAQVEIASRDVQRLVGPAKVVPKGYAQLTLRREVVKDLRHSGDPASALCRSGARVRVVK